MQIAAVCGTLNQRVSFHALRCLASTTNPSIALQQSNETASALRSNTQVPCSGSNTNIEAFQQAACVQLVDACVETLQTNLAYVCTITMHGQEANLMSHSTLLG